MAAFGREIFKVDLGSVGDPAVRVLFVASVVSLTAAVPFAIVGVLRTQPRLLVDTDQIVAFAKPPWIDADATVIEGKMLASLGQGLAAERKLNDRKAGFTDRAALALLIGLLTVPRRATPGSS